MAIKVDETNLTQEQYDAFRSLEFNPKYKLEMHRFNFEFTSHFISEDPFSSTGNDFDAIVTDNYIVRVTQPGLVARYDGASWVETTIAGYPNPMLNEPALAYDGSDLYLYVLSTDGIWATVSNDEGVTWDSFSHIVSWTAYTDQQWKDSLHIAAVGKGRLFYCHTDIVANNTTIYYTTPASGVNVDTVATGVTLTTPVRSLAAIDAATTSDPHHAYIYLAVDVPGRTSAKIIDNQVSKYYIRAGGLLSFELLYDTLADHIEIDVCDPMTSWRYRESVKISKLGNKYFLTSAAGDGIRQYNFSRYRFYTTKSPSKEWSNGFIIPGINAKAKSGLKLLEFGDYVFAINRKQMWRSPLTFITENSTIHYDISDRVLRYTSNIADMRQSGLSLSNEDGFFDDKISPEVTWSFIHYWGFDGYEPQQIAIEEVDSWEPTVAINEDGDFEKSVRATSRDRMAWMTDLVQSEQARYWQAQGMLADNYVDKTKSSYGGLMHTAVWSGTFKTKDQTLLAVSDNEEAVAASVFETGANWNGQTERGFRLSQENNNEYAGIFFRGIDKDNLWYVVYDQATDRVVLYLRKAGTNFVKYITSPLGWTANAVTQKLYLRVEFRYATIKVYKSTDSFTWTYMFTYVVDGQKDVITDTALVRDRPPERGSMGVIVKGHSTLDQWDLDPGFTDIGFITDPDGESTPPIKLYPVNTYDADQCLILTIQGRLFKVALNYYDNTTTVSEVDIGSTTRNLLINSTGDEGDCWGAYHMIKDPFDSNRIILQGAGGIAIVDDPWGTPSALFMSKTTDFKPIDAISWPNVKGYRPPDNQFYEGYLDDIYASEIQVKASVIGAPIVGARTRRGWFAWGSDRVFFYTPDYFQTIKTQVLGGAIESITVGPYNSPNYGEILCGCGGAVGSTPGIYRSKDWGESFYWSFFAFFAPWIGGNIQPTSWKYVNIPVTLGENIPNVSHNSAWTLSEWQVNMWAVDQPVGWKPETGSDTIVWIDSHGDRVTSGAAVVKGVQSSNLYLSPYNTQIGGPGITPLDIGGYNSHWNFQAISSKLQWQCMADGRAQYGVVGFRKYTQDWRYDIGDHTDGAGTYHNLVGFINRYAMISTFNGSGYDVLPDANLEADSGTEALVIDYSVLSGDFTDTVNANPEPGWIPRHLNGFPTNPQWMVLVGSDIHDPLPVTTYPYKYADRARLLVTTDGGQTLNDFSADLQSKLDALGYATGSNLSSPAYNQWIVAVEPDVRPVSEFIDSDDFDFDLIGLDDDWLDDDWGWGDFPIGPEYCINIDRARDCNYGIPATVEDAFRTYAGFAGIHDYKFYDTYKYDGSAVGWTTNNATLVAGESLVVTPDADDMKYGAIYGAEVPHNYLITYETPETWDNGLFLNLRDNSLSSLIDHHYWVGFSADGKPVVYKYIPGTGYTLVYQLDRVVSHAAHVQVAMRETFYRSEADSFWLVISIWVNRELICSYMEWIKEPPEAVYYWGVSSNSGTFEASNIRIPQLTEFVEWNSLDPGENVMGGLQRAIEGRYTYMFIRFDGSMFAWRNKQLDVSYQFEDDNIEQISHTLDNRNRVNHVRMVGAYKEAEYFRDDLGFHRFQEAKNPYLMTLRDCYLEARRQVQRQEELYDTISISTSYKPLLEKGDKVEVNGQQYIIDSVSTEIIPMQGVANFNLRKFILPD